MFVKTSFVFTSIGYCKLVMNKSFKSFKSHAVLIFNKYEQYNKWIILTVATELRGFF